MNTIHISIEKKKDIFTAYVHSAMGIYAECDTVEEAKSSVLDAIQMFREFNAKEDIPKSLNRDYQIVYQYDPASLLSYYSELLSKSALEQITGINHNQLLYYAKGLKVPREPQRKKIENSLHKLGSELLSTKLSDLNY